MAGRLRDFIAGYAYHVTHRGNRKTDIFLDNVDRGVYLKLLRTQCSNCGLREDTVISLDLPLLTLIPDWHAWLAKEEKAEDLDFIRQRTRTGQPCASDEFTRMLEAKLGRPLLRRKPGPKKKERKEEVSTPPLFSNNSGFE